MKVYVLENVHYRWLKNSRCKALGNARMGSRVMFLLKSLHQRDRIRGVYSRLSRFCCGVAIYLSNSLRKTCERAEIPLPLQRENE